MPRRNSATELLAEELAAGTASPLRRSSRIAATGSVDEEQNSMGKARSVSPESKGRALRITRSASKSPTSFAKEMAPTPTRSRRGSMSKVAEVQENTGSPIPAKIGARRRSNRSMSKSPTSEDVKATPTKVKGRRLSVTEKIVPLEPITETEAKADQVSTENVERLKKKPQKEAVVLLESIRELNPENRKTADAITESNAKKTNNVDAPQLRSLRSGSKSPTRDSQQNGSDKKKIKPTAFEKLELGVISETVANEEIDVEAVGEEDAPEVSTEVPNVATGAIVHVTSGKEEVYAKTPERQLENAQTQKQLTPEEIKKFTSARISLARLDISETDGKQNKHLGSPAKTVEVSKRDSPTTVDRTPKSKNASPVSKSVEELSKSMSEVEADVTSVSKCLEEQSKNTAELQTNIANSAANVAPSKTNLPTKASEKSKDKIAGVEMKAINTNVVENTYISEISAEKVNDDGSSFEQPSTNVVQSDKKSSPTKKDLVKSGSPIKTSEESETNSTAVVGTKEEATGTGVESSRTVTKNMEESENSIETEIESNVNRDKLGTSKPLGLECKPVEAPNDTPNITENLVKQTSPNDTNISLGSDGSFRFHLNLSLRTTSQESNNDSDISDQNTPEASEKVQNGSSPPKPGQNQGHVENTSSLYSEPMEVDYPEDMGNNFQLRLDESGENLKSDDVLNCSETVHNQNPSSTGTCASEPVKTCELPVLQVNGIGKVNESDIDNMSTDPYCGLSPPSVISVRSSIDSDVRAVECDVTMNSDNLQSEEALESSENVDSQIQSKTNASGIEIIAEIKDSLENSTAEMDAQESAGMCELNVSAKEPDVVDSSENKTNSANSPRRSLRIVNKSQIGSETPDKDRKYGEVVKKDTKHKIEILADILITNDITYNNPKLATDTVVGENKIEGKGKYSQLSGERGEDVAKTVNCQVKDGLPLTDTSHKYKKKSIDKRSNDQTNKPSQKSLLEESIDSGEDTEGNDINFTVNTSETKKLREYKSCSDENDSISDYLDDMAEEGEEDTPSEGSNDILDEGESIGSTDSEIGSNDSYEVDSFIDENELVDLLSGDEYDLGQSKRTDKKRSRIIQISDSEDEVPEVAENTQMPKELVKTLPVVEVNVTGKIEESDMDNMSTGPYCGLSPPSVLSVRSSTDGDIKSDDILDKNLLKTLRDLASGESSSDEAVKAVEAEMILDKNVLQDLDLDEFSSDEAPLLQDIVINREDNLKSLEEIKKKKNRDIPLEPEKLMQTEISAPVNEEVDKKSEQILVVEDQVKGITATNTPNNSLINLNRSVEKKSDHRKSINIHEDLSINNLKEGQLTDHITKVVDLFCTSLKKDGEEMKGKISINLSIDIDSASDLQDEIPESPEKMAENVRPELPSESKEKLQKQMHKELTYEQGVISQGFDVIEDTAITTLNDFVRITPTCSNYTGDVNRDNYRLKMKDRVVKGQLELRLEESSSNKEKSRKLKRKSTVDHLIMSKDAANLDDNVFISNTTCGAKEKKKKKRHFPEPSVEQAVIYNDACAYETKKSDEIPKKKQNSKFKPSDGQSSEEMTLEKALELHLQQKKLKLQKKPEDKMFSSTTKETLERPVEPLVSKSKKSTRKQPKEEINIVAGTSKKQKKHDAAKSEHVDYFKPSTTMEESASWESDVIRSILKPSSRNKRRSQSPVLKKLKKFKHDVRSDAYRENDFKNQMIYDPNRVKRMDTKALLQQKCKKSF